MPTTRFRFKSKTKAEVCESSDLVMCMYKMLKEQVISPNIFRTRLQFISIFRINSNFTL